MDPLVEDQVRPGWLGDVAQQGSARELGERVFFFEAVTLPLSGLRRDVLFLDKDLMDQRPQRVKIARAYVGGNRAIAVDERADATDQSAEECGPVELIDPWSFAIEVGGRDEGHNGLAR